MEFLGDCDIVLQVERQGFNVYKGSIVDIGARSIEVSAEAIAKAVDAKAGVCCNDSAVHVSDDAISKVELAIHNVDKQLIIAVNVPQRVKPILV